MCTGDEIMDLNFNTIGDRIRCQRKEKNMSQEKLAEIVGVGTTHISHIETGNSVPSLKVLLQIINALEINSDVILNSTYNNTKYIQEIDEKLAKNLSDCNTKELEFLAEVLQATKSALRKSKLN